MDGGFEICKKATLLRGLPHLAIKHHLADCLLYWPGTVLDF